MKKVALIFILATLAPSVVLAQTFHAAFTAEPTSNGKPLGFWLNQYTNSPESGRQEADKAIILCGTNALPWLLSELLVKDSPADLKNIPGGSSFWQSPADKRHWRAITGFWILGSIAKPAIGSLTNMIISGENPLLAAYALAAVGTNSFSALTNLVTHNDKNVRDVAVQAIDYYGYQSKQGGFAVPALVLALSDDSSRVRFDAAMALCVICEHPELAVPALRKSLKDEERGVRLYSVRALGRFRAESAATDILPLLDDREHDVRAAAAYWLGQTSHSKSVVIAVTKSLTDTNAEVRFSAAAGLGNIGSDAKDALPALAQALKDSFSTVGEAAAAAIKKIDPEQAKKLGIQ